MKKWESEEEWRPGDVFGSLGEDGLPMISVVEASGILGKVEEWICQVADAVGGKKMRKTKGRGTTFMGGFYLWGKLKKQGGKK